MVSPQSFISPSSFPWPPETHRASDHMLPPPPQPARYNSTSCSRSNRRTGGCNMATDGNPKDYSSLYCEDIPQPSNTKLRSHQTSTSQQHIQHQLKINQIKSDGVRAHKVHRESTVDLRAVVAKLRNLPLDNNYAIDTLSKHYSSVFVNRRKCQQSSENNKIYFKTCIQYFEERQTYVVRVKANTLKAVKERLPKRGNYRYFFKHANNICEEVESEEANVPYLEKDNVKHIYCQLFPI